MKNKIIIKRGAVIDFADLPQKSLALDGYVQGPEIDLENQKFSLDHHDNCIRLFTSATCIQVKDMLNLGFNPEGFTFYINDVDGDTVFAIWLLLNPEKALRKDIQAMVDEVGKLDAFGPAYPVNPDLVDPFFKAVMKPESSLRRSGEYQTADLEVLLFQCLENMDLFFSGDLEMEIEEEKIPEYKMTHTGNGWAMVKSDDFIFPTLYKEGITRAVAYKQLPDGSYSYTVAKKSDLVSDFPVGPHSKDGTILNALIQAEPGWGGGSSIGGSPRNDDGSSSCLTPDQVFALIQGLI